MGTMGRLGLQKRIVAYVTVGLVLLLGAFSFVAMQAIQRSTELVFEERLAIAQSVATSLSSDFHHIATGMVHDAIEEVGPESSGPALEAAVQDLYRRLSHPDSFRFFKVTGVVLLNSEGKPLATEPPDLADSSAIGVPTALIYVDSANSTARQAFWPEDGRPGQFVSLGVPLRDAEGERWGVVVITTAALNSQQPFVPFGQPPPATAQRPEQAPYPSQRSEYHLEILASTGTVILSIGPGEQAGSHSIHYPLIRPLLESGRGGVLIHNKGDDAGARREHVVALAPIPASDVHLLVEQDTDVALAVPNEFRRQFLLLGTLGLIAAVLVGLVTTRHVVNPTRLLAAAAVRMARGELSTPIQIRAQDEIGVLVENLETMRQQLRSALEEIETANEELERRVRERTGQLEEVVRRVLTAQEEERERIALELHDETAQALTALTMALDAVARRHEHLTPEDVAQIRDARQIASQLLDGIRQLIYALRPIALQDTGLATALRWYAEDYMGRAGVKTHVTTEGATPKFPDHVELALYRIGQEALNNVARHAQARNVWVTIASNNGHVRLTVRDDGIGFDPAAADEASRTRGVGLAGMRERANLVGATLRVESAPGRGTTVEVGVLGEADA